LDCLLANASIVPAVNQFELHVGMGDDPEGLVSYTARKGIVVQVRKPSATSRLKTALLRAVQCGVSPTGNPGC
jgi:diketogulonate reductase-like aldo/keto reductase